MKPILFILAAVAFALAAFKPRTGTIGWEWIGAALLVLALWVV